MSRIKRARPPATASPTVLAWRLPDDPQECERGANRLEASVQCAEAVWRAMYPDAGFFARPEFPPMGASRLRRLSREFLAALREIDRIAVRFRPP